MTYYNDNDPKACAWLRELIADGHLPAGDVDCRSITEVKPHELAGYDQCHFFAGIGGWPLALRWAGLEGVPGIWTGSCPCQPLSCAGKRQGHADERHLWPAFHALITKCRPATVFGEQVASKDGREWFAGVRLDLERLGYACGGADLCAAGVGAPHRRQRLYWVADSLDGRRQNRRAEDDGALRAAHCGRDAVALQCAEAPESGSGAGELADSRHAHLRGCAGCREAESGRAQRPVAGCGFAGGLANTEHDGGRADEPERESQGRVVDGRTCGMANSAGARCTGARQGEVDYGNGKDQDAHRFGRERQPADGGRMGNATGRGCGVCGDAAQPGRGRHADSAGWARYEILPCRDGKARRVESGTFPLADGVPGRVGLLRGYGNAIVPQVAAEFVMAWIECRAMLRGEVAQ